MKRTKVKINKIKSVQRNPSGSSTDFPLYYFPSLVPFPTVTHVENPNLKLTEEYYDSCYDNCGKRFCVRRFVWKNHNQIQVQLINYGARIVSIKMPNSEGTVQDIVVGFDGISRYDHYGNFKIGATIGRVCNTIRNATFCLDGEEHHLCPNVGSHHVDGGHCGFDKVLWKSNVEGSKVILTHVSEDKDQGYPGDLFLRLTFELTTKNEFHIDMEAFCNKPTIVDMTNNIYFNLGGHGSGLQHLRKHVVTINADYFTPYGSDGFPSGKIARVYNTKYDFLVPKKLKKLIEMQGEAEEIDQNFCVNRKTDDRSVSFVASVWHPSSSRMLEIYSNQLGVNLKLLGKLVSDKTKETKVDLSSENDTKEALILFADHEYLLWELYDRMALDQKTTFSQIVNLIRLHWDKFFKQKFYKTPESTPENAYAQFPEGINLVAAIKIKQLSGLNVTHSQRKLLEEMNDSMNNIDFCSEFGCRYFYLQMIVARMLRDASLVFRLEKEEEDETTKSDTTTQRYSKSRNGDSIETKTSSRSSKTVSFIVGKGGVSYEKNGAICLRTQNFPNAINIDKFPSCILNPGETYKHKIVYKFWRKVSTAKKYWKENMSDERKPVCRTWR